MDGLSAAASVIAVIDVSAKLLGVLGKYCKDAKDAKGDIQQLTQHVESLHGVLKSIQILIDGKDETKIPGIQSLKDSLAQCGAQVQELFGKLPDQKKFVGLRRSLKWPFDKPRVKEILNALESCKTTLSTSLAVNNLYVYLPASVLHSSIPIITVFPRNINLGTREEVETANANIKAAGLREKRQFLQNLEVEGAAFNSNKQQHDPRCLENTRTDLLNEIESWATSDKGPSIFWLRGMAGTGKSTISRTIAGSFNKSKILGASFFFSRGDGDRGRAVKFITTIASQLASRIPSFEQHLHEVVDQLGSTNIPDLDFRSQWSKLVITPLSESKFAGGSKQVVVLVIDALDECGKEDDSQLIVELLQSSASMLQSVELRTFITSRPEGYINRAFNIIPRQGLANIALHDISKDIVQADIKRFLNHEFDRIGKTRRLAPNWITDEQIGVLTKKSDGLFIYAATVCRFINDDADSPKNFLRTALEETRHGVSTTPDLDEIYLEILKTTVLSKCRPNQRESRIKKFKEVVGCLILLSQNFIVEDLASFLEKDVDSVREFLRLLSSVLDLQKSGLERSEVRLLHPSFRDFLLDPDRCLDADFQVNERETAKKMALRCIGIMQGTLRKDICGLGLPGVRIEDVENTVIDKSIPETTKHACLYWVDYLKRSEIVLDDDDEFHKFLQHHLLHWFEALSLMKKLSEGIRMIESLLTILGLWDTTTGANLTTLEGHSDCVLSVAFSDDGKQLASGSSDGTIKLWDITTGTNLATLEGHFGKVQSVAFLYNNNKQLASGSDDNTIKLWNITTGANLTLEGHSDWVRSVALSYDNKQLASGSRDSTVKLWDITTGTNFTTLEGHLGGVESVIFSYNGHSDCVRSVAFSHDGKQLASSSDDKTIKLWDTTTRVNLTTLKGHLSYVQSIAFSHDGTQLVSGSSDSTIKLWDITTGISFPTLEGHLGKVRSFAFSHDGKQLASGSDDSHSDWVQSVAFSHDSKQLASGSIDGTIKLWNITTGASFSIIEGPSKYVISVAFSHDSKQLASGGRDGSIKLWDTITGANIATLEGHSDWVLSVAFSHDSKQLASGSIDNTISLWDTTTGILSSSQDSLTLRYKEILSFPSSFQLSAVCFRGDAIAIGTESGHVFICILQDPLPRPSPS
ncbi:hypothetical protein ABW20_dc0108198 [Dactylellina cionopaga]|nr:hypothetical protein ABW20_dc0108198 [Dactylellina cionopaga]